MHWLDPSKKLRKQLGTNLTDLYFRVKFYVSDPSKLQHEFTRYQYYLQVRKDILEERLVIPISKSILLASFIAQAELGDYSNEKHDVNYLSDLKLVPGQTAELEKKIAELHKLHKGKVPADAEFHFLDHAKRIDMYGVDLHDALDSNHKDIQMGVTHVGLVVFRNNIKFNTFSWSKITKISFKRKQFFIQLRREPSEDYDTVLIFNMRSYRSCKTLWKSCVEHHTFFRMDSPKVKRKFLFTLGSKFTYSGRTEYQTVSESQMRNKNEQKFVRSPSRALIKPTSPQESKVRNFMGTTLSTRSYDNKVTSLGPKEPKKAWDTDGDETETDNKVFHEKSIEPAPPPFSPGRIFSYADEDPSQVTNGFYDSPKLPIKIEPKRPDERILPRLKFDEEINVTLFPDDTEKYGFNIKGGRTKEAPILVMKVAPDTPAGKSVPKLTEGDQIMRINGIDMRDKTYDDAITLIQDARSSETGKLALQIKQNALYIRLGPFTDEPMYKRQSSEYDNLPEDPLERSMFLLSEDLRTSSLICRFDSMLRKNHDLPCDEAIKPKNIDKNRYRDISPYDSTRVVLQNAPSGDYINANYINMPIMGTNIINKYIATQGPLSTTSEDFWQMILEENCTFIIMLTTLLERGRSKCHKYWPDMGEIATYENISIECIKEETDLSESFVFRDFTLKNLQNNEERQVRHIQYVAWPDHGVPSSPSEFLGFMERVCAERKDDSPLVVHCSAGIGRTGVMILMETAMCLIERNQPVYPAEIVKTMREQRAMMIQNASQYKFVCESVHAAYLKSKEKSDSSKSD